MKEIFDMWCPFCQFNFSYNWYDVDIGEEFLIDESNQMEIVYITERVRCPKCFTRNLIRKEILRTQIFQVSEELVREYRECSAATDCKSCGWNNARIGRQCACSLPELRELLEDPSEELTGWKAQMMRTFCGRGC